MNEKEFINSQVGPMDWMKDRPFDVVTELWVVKNSAEKRLAQLQIDGRDPMCEDAILCRGALMVCDHMLEGLGKLPINTES